MIKKAMLSPITYKLYKQKNIRIVIDDLFKSGKHNVYSDKEHLSSSIDWLCRAQDIHMNYDDSGGVSAGWNFRDGWLKSYPETSGYIVETLIAADKIIENRNLPERANKILDWLLTLQNNDGSFPGHHGGFGSKPVVFNTGQIMHGLLAGFIHFERTDCIEAACSAGLWLVKQQDEDGCWRRYVHNDIPHTYNSRTAWALLKTGLLMNEKKFINAAIKNLKWSLSQQNDRGWYKKNAFNANISPFTHTIAYAMRGLLESGILLDNEEMINSALKAAKIISLKQKKNGFLSGIFDEKWSSCASYCCLTGLAQIAIIWLRLSILLDSCDFTKNVQQSIQFLKKNHNLTTNCSIQNGAISGSYPIWGRYAMFEYPNWSCKFFSDLLAINITKESIP